MGIICHHPADHKCSETSLVIVQWMVSSFCRLICAPFRGHHQPHHSPEKGLLGAWSSARGYLHIPHQHIRGRWAASSYFECPLSSAAARRTTTELPFYEFKCPFNFMGNSRLHLILLIRLIISLVLQWHCPLSSFVFVPCPPRCLIN